MPRPALRRLAVNAVFLEPRMGGVETYARRLLGALRDARPELDIAVFVNESGRETLAEEPWAGSVSFATHRLFGVRGGRALGEALLVGPLARRRGADLLHSLAMTAPLRPGLPSVVTVPDVTWLRVPGAVPPATRRLWRTLVIPAARRADRVIAHSEAAKGEIAEDFAISPERIEVVPHGPGAVATVEPTPESELRHRFGLGEGPIVLAVSALLAHKNLVPLVEAMPIVHREVPDAVLVIPANPSPLQAELAAIAADDAVCFPGWVSRADLEGLYRAASCFAFPSLREGFGLPVLEAMLRGLPVACSNVSAVREVAGDAALLFDPRSRDEIAGAVVRLLTDRKLADELTALGRQRAALFSWARAADETLAVYERALATSGRQAHSTP